MAVTETRRHPEVVRPRWRLLLIELGIFAVVSVLAGVGLFAGGPLLRGWMASRAYEGDRQLLQEAIGSYPTVPQLNQVRPTLSGQIGHPREGTTVGYQCDGSDVVEVCSWIDIAALASGGHLSGEDAVNSADLTVNITAGNAPTGSYGWYIGEGGQVRSEPPFSPQRGYP